MFNKTILRLSVQEPVAEPPPPGSGTNPAAINDCILKTTALGVAPVSVSANTPGDITGRGLRPDEVIRTVTKPIQTVRPYTYTVTVYVEAYNFLRVTRGIANVVFSS